MNQNNANLGLLSNQQNTKYKEPSASQNDIELQDFGDDQEYISMDDAKIQHSEILLENNAPPPVQMLSSQNKAKQQPQQIQQQQQQQQQQCLRQQQQNGTLNNQSMYPMQPYPCYYQQSQMDQIYNSVTDVFQSTAAVINNRMTQQYASCLYCRTPQLLNDEKQPFLCYMCKQINKPCFSCFQCGTCRTTVMYQTGVSNLIKCTKCQTMNYVQQQNLPCTLPQLQQQGLNQQLQGQNQQQQPLNQQQQVLNQQQNPNQALYNSQRSSYFSPPQQSQLYQQPLPQASLQPTIQQPSIAKNQIDPL